jgi:hypothetical protein
MSLLKHLIALVSVPFSLIRVHIAETIFERFKNLPNKWRRIPPMKQTNSVFGLPESYDRVLRRFQQLAEEKKVSTIIPINDAKLIYQIILSAYHQYASVQNGYSSFQTKWESVEDTEEEVIDFFCTKTRKWKKSIS